ncbi:helix-turn-helix domain-containing protein [Natrialba sp. INN-245]|uniref:Winged helix-turn-helix transcriptional regulator n=1 Tax=Natrialba swarupiae TaxID=2448032 RepID=A0A5D5API1_9EURY|nr:helix-turn-helix domain-containing protein [Natrialba sp. INN-245]MCW8173298.1 ArsR family transcriptional regulator [Natrialba swarupiae]MWV41029.1 MarR family transcriptional regulator [Natrialba sp. INN-245]TYT60991.1 winged helix-turn-helix transcriptional regulator [Natrialba swarupiae]
MSRNDRGEYSSTVTDEEILAFIAREDRPIQTAQSISDQFGIDRSQAYRRLQRLSDDGVLERSKVGGRAVVWWLSTESERASEVLISDVNPDDPLFDRETFAAGEPTTTSERIDDILYGDAGPS